MRPLFSRAMRHRMVALSLLPPPTAIEPARPFGFGALVIEPRPWNDARFDLYARGYGAGYDPDRMLDELRSLFDPDTCALIYAPAPANMRLRGLKAMQYPARYRDVVPRSGLRRNFFVPAPRSVLLHAGGVIGVTLKGHDPSPLHRLREISAEAQAAWALWMFQGAWPSVRRDLFASHAAWQQLRKFHTNKG